MARTAENPEAYYDRAIGRGNQYDFDQAIADCSRAIEIDPTMAQAYFYRGLMRAKLEDFDEAIADFTKAVELDPHDGDAYINRGFA
jgi:tetratricopeptide (TPR) repeat protein